MGIAIHAKRPETVELLINLFITSSVEAGIGLGFQV